MIKLGEVVAHMDTYFIHPICNLIQFIKIGPVFKLIHRINHLIIDVIFETF